MCGIAGFVGNRSWTRDGDLSWLAAVEGALSGAADPARIDAAIDTLADRFADLMAFSTHLAAQGPAQAALRGLAARLTALEAELRASPDARAPQVERVAERLRDYAWQLNAEVLDNVERTLALLPEDLRPRGPVLDIDRQARARQMVAWAAQQVLENIDRLEVRGRDSSGVSVLIRVAGGFAADHLPAALRDALGGRIALGERHGAVSVHPLPGGDATVRFTYKVANLIGKLGDNGAILRRAMREDAVLWAVAARAEQLNIIAHTRWASHGAINLANCHPQNARLAGDDAQSGPVSADADVMVAANGDVDNYHALVESAVEGAGQALPVEVTTDTKIIPVLYRLDGGDAGDAGRDQRFLTMLRRLDGSIAVILQHPQDPERVRLGQKGSGQSLFVAQGVDGLIIASENYGLAARARASVPLTQVERGGLMVTVSVADGEAALTGRTVDDGAATALKADAIDIFSRDIFRGRHAHFFEKEVHEAPHSVAKTLVGRYHRQGRAVRFTDLGGPGAGPWTGLRARLADPSLPPVRHILVTGQGTAAIAAMGVEHLIRQALGRAPVTVASAKASELSANLEGRDMADTLVIAISQSGTTTDTNRTVDLARAAGAWIHAIVNRRNSPLVRKSDSHLFTSDGRDIEMAVASTKAFYSQVAAGKLTALCLADVLGTLDAVQIHDEVVALEALPDRIAEVLADEKAIAACAAAYAPRNRYWAVVGNGANKIAAEEIRIKLSELCYKSIPVDYTEDKKHIDLSTEPLTLVIANDLPPLLAQDTAKEVAIFKAHNGKPIVFAARGETCFDSYAEAVIRLPSAGAGLDFVIATVAGHLWGFHAALSIDAESRPFREISADLDRVPGEGRAALAPVLSGLAALQDRIADGWLDAALPPRHVALLARLGTRLATLDPDAPTARATVDAGLELLRQTFEETSRPIDTIRHQAKTVTVGISRPGREISPLVHAALAALGVAAGDLAEVDRQMLVALSGAVIGVEGGVRYQVAGRDAAGEALLRVAGRSGIAVGRASRYETATAASGSKRRALRLGRAVLSAGPRGDETLVIVPLPRQPDWQADGLALLHLALIPQASLQQKTALLRDLKLYEDLFDAHQEGAHQEEPFAAFLEAVSPRDLLLRGPAALADRRR